ncbi:hypothetical protein [Algoriphagus formosus]|uniref:hypothetical protein n=1 Tax=Algoriphagus formosus TaxID=2007308 RepID=UPI000C28C402|nr:hypothetical protein [Algoriphagus formosus]
MKNYRKPQIWNLTYLLFTIFFFACTESEDPQIPAEEELEDSLYFDLTIDGKNFRTEIPEADLVPNTGFEKNDSGNPGINAMFYNFFDYSISILMNRDCGTEENRDCIDLIIFRSNPLSVGNFANEFTNGLLVGGDTYALSYTGPNISPDPSDQMISMEITKFDEEISIVEGTLSGSFYKAGDTTPILYPFSAKFRIYIQKF